MPKIRIRSAQLVHNNEVNTQLILNRMLRPYIKHVAADNNRNEKAPPLYQCDTEKRIMSERFPNQDITEH